MNPEEMKIGTLYNRIAPFYDLEAASVGFSASSYWRKIAVGMLNLVPGMRVLDIACGTGLNFNVIENHIGEHGELVGIDLAWKMLDNALRRCGKNDWNNVRLVHESIVDYKPRTRFDAAVCTLAMEIVPDYKEAVDNIFRLLKPHGRFAMIGVKTSRDFPFSILNLPFKWLCTVGKFDLSKNVASYIKSKYSDVEYREFWGGFCYVISASKSHFKD
jgi:demethylmenaquinone methyltransferase/2-methoxy-6-polyprenyl-1,4-benzoquinol methylase